MILPPPQPPRHESKRAQCKSAGNTANNTTDDGFRTTGHSAARTAVAATSNELRGVGGSRPAGCGGDDAGCGKCFCDGLPVGHGQDGGEVGYGFRAEEGGTVDRDVRTAGDICSAGDEDGLTGLVCGS